MKKLKLKIGDLLYGTEIGMVVRITAGPLAKPGGSLTHWVTWFGKDKETTFAYSLFELQQSRKAYLELRNEATNR